MEKDYKVKDINLAEFGRKEISIARVRDAWTYGTSKRIQRKETFKGC